MKHLDPPIWANRFLEWYCRADRLEEIQGDVHELFERTARKRPRLARLQFVWNVIRFFRLKNIRKYRSPSSPKFMSMFSNYLLIGFRNAIRQGMTSFINIGGLALGVAGAVTIFIFADQWFHTDDFHVNKDRIFEVTNRVNRDSTLTNLADVPLLLGPMMKDDISGIANMTRLEVGNANVRHEDKVFFEKIYYVDPSFFQIFSFDKFGVPPDALASKNNTVLSQQTAEKYFGTDNPVGQTISIKFSNGQVIPFTVAGVADLPDNNTIDFRVVLTMDVFLDLKFKDAYDWSYLTDGLFIELQPGARVEDVAAQMAKYKALQNQSSPEWPIDSFRFFNIADLSWHGSEIESRVMGPGEAQGVIAMSIISFLLLLLACFNYTNIAVATITTRLKEIGIRKVVGGRRVEIIQQFLIENLMFCVFSVGLGVLISRTVFMPGISATVGYPVPFAFSSSQVMITFLLTLITFTVLVSGVYPAVFVSGFQPVTILKGKEKFGQRSAFSRILLTGQFILAFTTIVGSLQFIDNSLYMRNKDWGYDHSRNIMVPVNTFEQYLKLRDKVAAEPAIEQYAGAANHVGYGNRRTSLEHGGTKTEIVQDGVGYGYIETMNLRLKEGRFFNRSMPSDSMSAVVVNEAFVRMMGWTDGLNEFFQHEGKQWTVIGIVKDFHHDNFYYAIQPVMFTLVPEEKFRYMTILVSGDKATAVEAEMRTWWKDIGPDDPYRGILQDDVFYDYMKNNRSDMTIITTVAVVTMMLACLGLFGLVSYNITRRLKEFSVRKVFGANVIQIFRLMNRDYVWILGIAFVIGAPAGFFLINILIDAIYPSPKPAGPVPFLAAVTLMVVTVAATIGSQMSRVVRENPARTLRSE